MLRRVLQILAVCSALLFLVGAMMTLGIGPFGGTKVRRLFANTPEALAGLNAVPPRGRKVTNFKPIEEATTPVAAAAPEADAGTPVVDAGSASVDAGRPRMLMPATKSMGPVRFDLGEPEPPGGIALGGEKEPALAVEPAVDENSSADAP